jgi:hypothetical protein
VSVRAHPSGHKAATLLFEELLEEIYILLQQLEACNVKEMIARLMAVQLSTSSSIVLEVANLHPSLAPYLYSSIGIRCIHFPHGSCKAYFGNEKDIAEISAKAFGEIWSAIETSYGI